MQKIIKICTNIIILSTLSIYIYLNICINNNLKINKKIINNLNKIFKEQKIEIYNEFINELPKLQINGIDYIGIINITKINLSLPIEAKCNSSFTNIQSACNYSNNSLIILGTNLKDSFNSILLYNIDDEIMFTNMLGQTFKYKITKIKRINNLDKLTEYKEDLIIIIKNYYNIEYILLICNSH